MASTTSAIVVAIIAAIASLSGSLAVEISRRRSTLRLEEAKSQQQQELEQLKNEQQRQLEQLKNDQQRELKRLEDELGARREAASKAAQAAEIMATYRNPLARSAYDLQSRLYNIDRGFRGFLEPAYYRDNTLFVVAEFLGWLEIVRREVQFLDADAVESTRELQRRIDAVRDVLARRTRRDGTNDDLYVYRGHQRAIGELMVVDNAASNGPAHTCRGYASFVEELGNPAFARWFDRLGTEIVELPRNHSPRLMFLQHALIDLVDVLDPDHVRFPDHRERIVSDRARQ